MRFNVEYELYVPLNYNNGLPIETRKIETLKNALIDRFGGLSSFSQAVNGVWKDDERTYHDEIVVLRVLVNSDTDKGIGADIFMSALRKELKEAFRQEEFLIIKKAVTSIE